MIRDSNVNTRSSARRAVLRDLDCPQSAAKMLYNRSRGRLQFDSRITTHEFRQLSRGRKPAQIEDRRPTRAPLPRSHHNFP